MNQIKIRIKDDSPKAIRIAQAFNSYKDKKMLPIIGKIISYRRTIEGGYKMFVEIADGMYVRIDEQESNIKICFVAPSPDRPPELQVDVEKYVDKYVEKKMKEEMERVRLADTRNYPHVSAGKNSQYFALFIVITSIIVLITIFWIISRFF